MMFSFRYRHRPEAPSIQPLASTTSSGTSGKPSVGTSMHHFTSRVIVFDQINQVTTRVKSEPMLIKKRRACTRSVEIAFAESCSFASPSDDFTAILRCSSTFRRDVPRIPRLSTYTQKNFFGARREDSASLLSAEERGTTHLRVS